MAVDLQQKRPNHTSILIKNPKNMMFNVQNGPTAVLKDYGLA